MVAIELDPKQQNQLDQLARQNGQDVPSMARQILVDYLDFQSLPDDSDEAWAEASVALAPEVMEKDHWDEADYGP